MIGQKFGHYLIEQKLGEGGMGVVYRARDEKLQREVALKFLETLPTGSSASHERVLQEARAISALNHPNICTVYEVGEIENKPYIAMEFVEGRPLTMEITSNGMALEQVERYGMQLADALGHAHSRGVIHRDLKSANVMVTPEGRIKVLDFGIARLIADAASSGVGTKTDDQAFTSSGPGPTLTIEGTVLGTPQYLPPEVVQGRPADGRSDLWSLGVLLYEMTSGKLPFAGGSMNDLALAIVNREPTPLPPTVPS